MAIYVSLADELFSEADEYARERGLSRSELYARALEEYLARQKYDEITARLDAVYADDELTGLEW